MNNNKRTNNNKKKIIINYNPHSNVNTNRSISDLELLLKQKGIIKENADTNYNLNELIDIFNKNISNGKENRNHLLKKYELDNLFQEQKHYKLGNENKLFTKGAIVKSQTTGNSFELLEPLYRTLKLANMKPRKIYIYKKLDGNVYYIYSNWGQIQDYSNSFRKKLIEYLIEYIKYIIDKYSIDVSISKFILAGHSEGANVSQNLIVAILRNKLIPTENLFLISLSYPQALTQVDLEYLYDNLDGNFISLVAMGYLEDRNSNNVNLKLTKNNIRTKKALANNYTKIFEYNNNNINNSKKLQLLKSLCIFFDYNKGQYIPKAIYNLDDYMSIIENKPTFSYGRNSHDLSQKHAHKFHDFTRFIKSAIISLTQ